MHYPHEIECNEGRQLALQVDGVPLRGGASAAYTVQAVISSFSKLERERLEQLHRAVGPEIGVVDSFFDDISTLLQQLGFRTRPIAGEDLGETELRVAAIGCPHRHTRLDRIDSAMFLERGGVLVSSDKAIRLPGISAYLEHLTGRPPARARLTMDGNDECQGFAPAWLDPGHLPIDLATNNESAMETLASNPLTGDPLVVAVRAGSGTLIHSVPHWLQVPHEHALTSVERRPLRDVPRFRHTGNSYPGISFGAFMAQRSMVELLLESMATAIGVPTTADSPGTERGK